MSDTRINTYKAAGVDIEKGDRFTEFIKHIKSDALLKGIGGFAGGIELPVSGYISPVLLSCTDGVGTKLLVAKKLQNYSTVGIDLVAMSVNDLLACGAKPLMFLDYIACGKISEEKLQEIVTGIVRGCELAHTKLAGGETAEMPDMYAPDEIDLAGFATGLVEKAEMLPKKASILKGDVVLGLPSSGIHSNGYSLARKVVPRDDSGIWEQLLIPTRIYTDEMELLLATHKVLAAAHITGGGLYNNLKRVIPENLKLKLYHNWRIPEVFTFIQEKGNISRDEMFTVFNMGIGMAIIVKNQDKESLSELLRDHGFPLWEIGVITE
ncbi:MAG: phosphoribosylformylglycinamidine cyclo-ligase [Spirochaetales bacterium]|nr:phosphoribosylformylglycinamidine cyclo-ligase [Spirochaetales bacterium]